MLKVVGIVAVGIMVVAAGVLAFGRYVWNRETAASIKRLRSAPITTRQPATYALEQIETLPAPVQRYFRFALKPGQPIIRQARIMQQGEFAMKPGTWSRFSAVETFVTDPPRFVWHASISMAPLLTVYVIDSYTDGQGALTAKVAGLVTVANDRGTNEMNSGQLFRYLAEAVYLPTALLPSERVVWSPIDDNSAKATLTDRTLSVSLDFHFDSTGAADSVCGERYYRAPDGKTILAKWLGHWGEYARKDGMMVPSIGDVGWMFPTGPLPYWRARTERVEYEFV